MIAAEPKRTFCFGSTYEAYKKGTADVASFLKDRAREVGLNFSSHNHAKTYSNIIMISPTTEEHYSLSSDQYVSIAAAIVKARKKGKKPFVPDWLITRLDDTIKSRRRVADFYGELCASDTYLEEDHQKHLYFIWVLEKVQQLLAPLVKGNRCSPGEESASSNVDALDSPIQHLANRFGNLPLYVPTNSTKANTSISDSENQAIKPMKGQSPTRPDIEEELMPLHCFFLDMEELRNYISEVWTEYAQRKDSMDLMTASLLSNTAIELAVSQYDDKFSSSEEYSQLVDRYIKLCKGASSKASSEIENIHDLTMFHTLQTLKDFKYQHSQKFYQQRKKAKAKTNKLTVISLCESSNSSSESLMDICRATKPEANCNCEYKEDESILLQCLTEAWVLTSEKNYHGNDDMYNTYGDQPLYAIWNLQHESKGDRIDFCVVVSMQILLETYKCLKNNGCEARPLEQLRSAAKVTKASVTLTAKGPALAMKESKYLRMHTTMAETFIDNWALTDVVETIKKARFPRRLKNGSIRQEPYLLYRLNPIMCGCIQFRLMFLAGMNAGLEIASMLSTIQAPIHLYNALQRAKAVKREWKDGEWFIQYFTEQGVFKGSRPISSQRCLKQWNDHINFNPIAPREYWAKTSSVVQFFSERFGPNLCVTYREISTVATIVTDTRTTPHTPYLDEEPFRRMLKNKALVDSILKGETKETPKPSTPTEVDMNDFSIQTITSTLKAVDILKGLRIKLVQISPKIRFDYLAAHRRGFDLQVALRDFLRKEYRDLFEDDDFVNEGGISMIPGDVIRWIAGYSSSWTRFTHATPKRRQEMVDAVGKWFDQYIEKHGSAEVDKMNMMRKYF